MPMNVSNFSWAVQFLAGKKCILSCIYMQFLDLQCAPDKCTKKILRMLFYWLLTWYFYWGWEYCIAECTLIRIQFVNTSPIWHRVVVVFEHKIIFAIENKIFWYQIAVNIVNFFCNGAKKIKEEIKVK